jgi:site-specific DNA recombinase
LLPVSLYIEDGPGVELARLSVEQQRIVRLLIEKVIVSPDDLEVRFRPNGIEVLALELQPEPAAEPVEEAVA